jgi:hypothetical protein
VGLNLQTSNRLLLLRLRRDWAVFSLVALVAQLRLASRKYLHPRDVQWPLWLDLDVREHLWLAERRTLWGDNNCHSRRNRRVRRHLWGSNGDIFVPEASRQTSS